MFTLAERAETEKNLAAAKQCFMDSTTATIAPAAHDHNVKDGTLWI